MSQHYQILRFDEVSFAYDSNKPILNEASFSLRDTAKFTLMGQNGAGKSTIFKLITGEKKPDKGQVYFSQELRVAIAKQVMEREYLTQTVRSYFAHAFEIVPTNLDKHIADVFEVVNFSPSLDTIIGDLSGGQQARLLLAFALIQEPDILLLDEPTNNLDQEGIDHLLVFLIMYPKTVLVISHDAEFLNAFTEGVLHLDVYTGKIEKYDGNYTDVVEEIAARVEKDRARNAQLLKTIQDRKDKINFFAHKGGKMRKLASKLRDEVEEAEENMTSVRQDDKTIRPFTIPAKPFNDVVLEIKAVKVIKNQEAKEVNVSLSLRTNTHLLVKGPNGIGKSTLLRTLAEKTNKKAKIHQEVNVAYYKQDFSGLNFEQSAYESLAAMMDPLDDQVLRHTAAKFLFTGDTLATKVGALSEGQKGLLAFARFVLQEPNLLIVDEPTNHINFRHLPIIANALNTYKGCLIVVSHAQDFVEQIRIDNILELDRLIK
ncbi:hypothetical protein CO172_01370 [Candidatus Uhrbacteria bacterium CG_4_9_14_3_um_filter_36_7]|uniref:ABC transporter domain-containing protein n=1 Tax=Candidatus Uhrbacteria bacterium CG_4_9_14_3_um_filter_36_7 TaxID=1975033 RepID=A0A2M7XHW4_9BACT|nr:MAG: hypothetical protein CO172_01370 [Candidatus Uhrbacteria bacterium CG_4_9_14_3_um_filter_36_7]